MRLRVDIDELLMSSAQKAGGYATKKQTVEEALRLLVRLRREHEARATLGAWRGNLTKSRKDR
jgi:Arc/MetJ family transcription regulator